MSTAETIEEIRTAIPGVCGPKLSKIERAEKFVNENVNDLAVVLDGLNKICGGSFAKKAIIEGVLLEDEGDQTAGAYIPIGTLGSSYACTSTGDTNPVLIATGKNIASEMEIEKQKCAKWSVFTHDGRCKGERIYLSYSSDGSCFEAESCDDGAGPAYVYCIYGLDH
jgi:hypothetical protein